MRLSLLRSAPAAFCAFAALDTRKCASQEPTFVLYHSPHSDA